MGDEDHPLRAARRGTRVFNQDLYGGFLIYFVPDMPVFIDDRCELYGEAFLTEFADALRQHPERLAEWTRQYHITLALTDPKGNFTKYLRSSPAVADGWTLVREGPAACLFERRAPP